MEKLKSVIELICQMVQGIIYTEELACIRVEQDNSAKE